MMSAVSFLICALAVTHGSGLKQEQLKLQSARTDVVEESAEQATAKTGLQKFKDAVVENTKKAQDGARKAVEGIKNMPKNLETKINDVFDGIKAKREESKLLNSDEYIAQEEAARRAAAIELAKMSPDEADKMAETASATEESQAPKEHKHHHHHRHHSRTHGKTDWAHMKPEEALELAEEKGRKDKALYEGAMKIFKPMSPSDFVGNASANFVSFNKWLANETHNPINKKKHKEAVNRGIHNVKHFFTGLSNAAKFGDSNMTQVLDLVEAAKQAKAQNKSLDLTNVNL